MLTGSIVYEMFALFVVGHVAFQNSSCLLIYRENKKAGRPTCKICACGTIRHLLPSLKEVFQKIQRINPWFWSFWAQKPWNFGCLRFRSVLCNLIFPLGFVDALRDAVALIMGPVFIVRKSRFLILGVRYAFVPWNFKKIAFQPDGMITVNRSSEFPSIPSNFLPQWGNAPGNVNI